MKYEELKKLFDTRLEKNLKVQSLLEKVRTGKADLSDTAELSNLVSSILSYLIKSNLEVLDDPEDSAKRLLRDYYDRINGVLEDTQQSLDDKTGLHIKPAKAPYPRQRVDQLAHSLIDPTVSAAVRARRAENGIENTARSFHDDYVEANVKRRSRAGVKCYIVRTTHGDCCDWCSKLAGRYEQGSEPDDVYRRHDNCDCTTIFENGRERQDVWSKTSGTNAQAVQKEALRRSRERDEKKRQKAKVKYIPERFTREQAQSIQDEKLREFQPLKNGNKSLTNIKKNDNINKKSNSVIGSNAFSKEAKDKMHRDEKIISGNRYETAVIYDSDGKIMFKNKGDASSVEFTSKEIKSMNGKILTHNHPNASSFSTNDINMLRRAKLAEIRACNVNGAYVLRPPKKWSSDISTLKKLDTEYEKIYSEISKKYQDKAAKEGVSILSYFDEMEEKTLEHFCNKYGFEYEFEEY